MQRILHSDSEFKLIPSRTSRLDSFGPRQRFFDHFGRKSFMQVSYEVLNFGISIDRKGVVSNVWMGWYFYTAGFACFFGQ